MVLASEVNELAGQRILIVEDEAHVAHLLDVLLRKQGYQTQVVENGLEAWEAISQSPPDLVLLDLLMPVMSGYQLLDRLRATPETAAVPVVLVTTEENLASGPATGHPSVLKPFSPQDLYAAVERALDHVSPWAPTERSGPPGTPP
jgi:CheY-like chemotaxis protein